MRRPLVPLLLCVVLAAACGSTVQSSSTVQTQGGSSGGGVDALTGEPTPQGDGTAATNDLSAGGSTSGSSGTAGGTTGTDVGATTGTIEPGTSGAMYSPPPGLTRAPGVTASQIKVGLIRVSNGDALNSAAGAGAITKGDDEANDNAVVADINKRGGIAGRKLTAVYGDFDATSTQTLDQQYAALCQKFTRDTPVFAVVGGANESYRKCIAKAGIVYIDNDLPAVGAQAFQTYPGFIELGYPNIDRLAAYTVTSLQEQGYFEPWSAVTNQPVKTGKPMVGILTYNDTVFSHAVDTFMVPALKRLGYTPIVAKIAQVNTAGDYGGQAAAVKSAQLTFASNNVTHLISFESNGGLSLFFLPTAKSQRYFPRYGINSASGFQALMDTGVTDGTQLHGALGFGWIANLDMPSQFNPDNGKYSNPERKRCFAVFKKAGITFDSTNASSIGLSICGALELLKVTLDKTPTQITFGTFVSTVGGLGTSYQPAGNLGVDFRPTRHDPTSRAYHLHYFKDCDCFHYDGSIRTIP